MTNDHVYKTTSSDMQSLVDRSALGTCHHCFLLRRLGTVMLLATQRTQTLVTQIAIRDLPTFFYDIACLWMSDFHISTSRAKNANVLSTRPPELMVRGSLKTTDPYRSPIQLLSKPDAA